MCQMLAILSAPVEYSAAEDLECRSCDAHQPRPTDDPSLPGPQLLLLHQLLHDSTASSSTAAVETKMFERSRKQWDY